MIRRLKRRAAGALLEPLEGRRLLSATISGTAFNDPDGNGTRDASEGALAGRTVWLDVDNDGVIDSGTATVPSTDVPRAIPDNAGISSNLVVSGLSGLVTDLNVTANITHTYDSDLTVDLVSPTGQSVRLFANVGSSGDNFVGTLDDEAGTAVTAGVAPFSGSFRPIGALSIFDGANPNGTWRLEVNDTVAMDSGTLNGWSLTIATAEATATTDSTGAYRFTVAAGNYAVRQVLPAGWVGTAPAGGAHAITAVDGQAYPGRDFGSGLADAPPVATLVSAPNVTTYGGASYYYSVRYGDAVSVDYTSIANGHDTEVTGPGGFVAPSTLANLVLSGNQWTATYLITPPGGTWDAADVGAYTISLRENEVSDLTGHFTKAAALGTFAVSDPPPTATLTDAPNVSAFGGTTYYYTVRYDDNVFVDYTCVGAGATQVTGPGGFSAGGTLANLSQSGKVWTATYAINAPGGTWNGPDAGAYTISLNPGRVKDLAGNFTPGGALGTFTVSDTPPAAAIVSAPNVTALGGTTYYYTVNYTDNQSGDYHTIVAGNDTQVTGPGFATPALGTLANLTLSGSTWTATYYVSAPGGTWDASESGTYTISLRANEVADDAGNFTPAALLAAFTVNDPPPTATLTSAPNVVKPFSSFDYRYTVRYADNGSVDYATIQSGNDTEVTGPGGYSQLGTLVDLTVSGGVWSATYSVKAPAGGTWNEAENGGYKISLRANEVSDTDGNFAPPGQLGGFAVTSADLTPPTATLVSAPDVHSAGTGYYVTVRYSDDSTGVDTRSILAGNDIVVTGPGGFSALGTAINLVTSTGGWDAGYVVAPPGGSWDAGDAGTYTVSMRANEVKDLGGNYVPPVVLGTFRAFPPAAAGVAGVSGFSDLPIVAPSALDLATVQNVLA